MIMKKQSLYIAIIGIALLSVFSACKKENSIVPDGKILFSAGYVQPSSDSKYTILTSTQRLQAFFNSNDQVYINGLPYTVFPYATTDDESDNASSHARIWADISSDHTYKGLYPASAFTSDITNFDHPTILIPETVKVLPYNTDTRIHEPVDGRILPTTAYCTSNEIEDSLVFRNTMSFIRLEIVYDIDFAKRLEAATGTVGYPPINIESVRLTTDATPLSGSGYIQNPFTQQPYAVLNSGNANTIYYSFSDISTNISAGSSRRIGLLPIIPNLNTRATMEIIFTTLDGSHHFRYTKRSNNSIVTTRSKFIDITVYFESYSDYDSNVEQID
jgi:hypothetical protein